MHVRWAFLTLGVIAFALASASADAARRNRSHANPSPVTDTPAPTTQTIGFNAPCAKGERLTIAGVGDLLFHRELEQEALTPTGKYSDFWKPLAGVLANADLTYGNIEGSTAEGITTGLDLVKDPGRTWNNHVYMGAPLELSYNYHPSLIDDLIASGFDVVSTANNHALDRGSIGIDRTVLNLQRRGLAFSGTRLRDATQTPFSVVTKAKGFNLAWVACTFDTNGFRDNRDQVFYCFKQRDQVLSEIKRLAASPEIDAVVLTPHWGVEGSPTPEQRQRDLARDAIAAGASLVMGTHPHVVGPWEKITTPDGREGLVIYSTGNFISNQRKPEQRTGELALVELTKEPGAAKARVTAAGYITTWVDVGAVHRVAEAPASLVSRVLPSGNRVFVSELPKLPRSCEAGSDVVASWGAPPTVTIAMLPLPPDAPLPRTPKTGVAERDDLKPPPAAVAVSEAPQRLVDVIPPPPASPEPAPPVAQKAPSTDSKPAGKASPQVAAAPATVHGTRVTALATNNVQNGQKAKPGFIAVSTASHRPKRILAAVTPVSGTVLTVTRHNQTSRQ